MIFPGVIVIVLALLARAAAQEEPERASVDFHGYVETYWSYNFNDPSNDVSNVRGYDSRTDTFTLSNVALEATGTVGDLTARVVGQVGQAPSTYYRSEPVHPAVGTVGPSDAVTWRNLQQAWGKWQATDALAFDAGLFLSPIGPEGLAIEEEWNYSRSNEAFALPNYFTGARATYEPSEPLTLTAAVFNGWNSVDDNNDEKSVCAQAQYSQGPISSSLLYFGGVERPEGSPAGRPWRRLFDAWVQIDATKRFSFVLYADAGFEDNDFGTSWWASGAAYARVMPVQRFYVAARADSLREVVPPGATPILLPATDPEGVGRVASGTLTFDWRPTPHNLSLRVEGRIDDANADMYFEDDVATDPITGAAILNADSQQTVTIGAVAWF